MLSFRSAEVGDFVDRPLNKEVVLLATKPSASVRFLVTFIFLYPILFWLGTGSGPIDGLNTAVGGLTRVQASLVGAALAAAGEHVVTTGTVLSNGTFSCDVNEGCNGMSAVSLLLAGVLSFPVPWRDRFLGAFLLAPIVLLVNLVRIGGLFLTGAHWPQWFNTSHIYIGQVVVILISATLWWSWLTWTFRNRRPSS